MNEIYQTQTPVTIRYVNPRNGPKPANVKTDNGQYFSIPDHVIADPQNPLLWVGWHGHVLFKVTVSKKSGRRFQDAVGLNGDFFPPAPPAAQRPPQQPVQHQPYQQPYQAAPQPPQPQPYQPQQPVHNAVPHQPIQSPMRQQQMPPAPQQPRPGPRTEATAGGLDRATAQQLIGAIDRLVVTMIYLHVDRHGPDPDRDESRSSMFTRIANAVKQAAMGKNFRAAPKRTPEARVQQPAAPAQHAPLPQPIRKPAAPDPEGVAYEAQAPEGHTERPQSNDPFGGPVTEDEIPF